jgi:hypothetical protein
MVSMKLYRLKIASSVKLTEKDYKTLLKHFNPRYTHINPKFHTSFSSKKYINENPCICNGTCNNCVFGLYNGSPFCINVFNAICVYLGIEVGSFILETTAIEVSKKEYITNIYEYLKYNAFEVIESDTLSI